MSLLSGVIPTYNMIKAVIYPNMFRPNEVHNQYVSSFDILIKQDLYSIDQANITIPYVDEVDDTNWWCDLYEITGNEDKKVFEWYILDFTPWFRGGFYMDLNVRGKKEVLKSRKALDGYNYTNTNAKTVVELLLSAWNAKGDEWVTDWNLYPDPTEPKITIDIKLWDNYYDIFDEIAKQIGGQWDYIDGRIYFAQNLWDDFSSESSIKYTELHYDWKYGQSSKIKNIIPKIVSDRSNVVIWVDVNNNKLIREDITAWKVYWCVKENFRDWDLAEKTEAKLVESNRSQIVYDIIIDTILTDANKGDKVRLRVENHPINKFNMNESMIVIKKETRYSNMTKSETITLWKFAIQEMTLAGRIREIKKTLDLLSI